MALSAHSIPTIVSSAILETLQNELVYSRLFNQNFTGDVVPGNTVKIPSIGSVTVRDYSVYTDMLEEEASDASQSMVIDQQKYFNIVLDDIDAAMAKPEILAAYAREAAYQMRDTIDAYLGGVAAAGSLVTGLGDGTTPLSISDANVESTLIRMARLLDENNVPRAGRVVVVPPWFVEVLVTGNLTTKTDNLREAENGTVGRFAGFDILMSNNVPNTAGDKWKIVGGSNVSATMALAINKTEVLRHEKQFADKLRGLAVYGSKLTRATTVAVATCDEA